MTAPEHGDWSGRWPENLNALTIGRLLYDLQRDFIHLLRRRRRQNHCGESSKRREAKFRANFPLDLQAHMAAPPFTSDLTIYRENGALMASYNGGQSGARLVPIAPDRFYITDFSLRSGVFELKFNRNSLAQITSVRASMASAETVYLPAS